MLCVSLKSFAGRACGLTTGGVSRVWLFDREDFNFTQGAASGGDLPAYTAVARRAGAETGVMYPVVFEKDEAEYKYSQSVSKGSVNYDHSLELFLKDLDLFITQWNIKIDAAAACCGIGLIVELNSGKMFVMGEKYVNGSPIAGDWKIVQDGASGTSGKLRTDANGHTTVLKGGYNRLAYTYTGTVGSITTLETPGS